VRATVEGGEQGLEVAQGQPERASEPHEDEPLDWVNRVLPVARHRARGPGSTPPVSWKRIVLAAIPVDFATWPMVNALPRPPLLRAG